MPASVEDQIVRSALSQFARFGYEATTTKRIAKASKVSQGSIFRIFGTKQRLFRRCLEVSYITNLSSPSVARSLNTGEHLAESITNAVDAMFTHVSQDHVRLTMFALLERPDLIDTMDYGARESENSKYLIASRIEEEKNVGTVRADVDSGHAAEFLLDSIASLQLRGAVEKRGESGGAKRIKLSRVYVDLWCSALAPKGEPSGKK